MTNLQAELSQSNRLARFTNILNSVADTRVRKTKPCRKAKPWVTPHVRAKIRIRNRLQRTIKSNQQEWIEACRKANKAKTENWKEVLEGAITNTLTVSMVHQREALPVKHVS